MVKRNTIFVNTSPIVEKINEIPYKIYLTEGTLRVKLFSRGFAWLDTGNCDSLLDAGNFIATIQNRQGFYVSCIEEIAWRNGWISTEQLAALGKEMKTAYGRYLERIAAKGR